MQRLWGDLVALLASMVEECEGKLGTSIRKDSLRTPQYLRKKVLPQDSREHHQNLSFTPGD